MKKLLLVCGLALACAALAAAQQGPEPLLEGVGTAHHPVSTAHPEAQKYFDQGLRYLYAFNHDAATRSFQRAAELDPGLAMAHWGIALSVGPNYNDPGDAERQKVARGAMQQALALAPKASEPERAYIEALAKRYAGNDAKQAAADYSAAMRALMQRYPDDLDAATLYAESVMNLKPWKLWMPDGTPWERTPEIIAVLESVLRRDPDHAGAIHYYIHATEASPNPERALGYAPKLGELAPAAGHLVHMPAHVYGRTGDYAASMRANAAAAEADRRYLERTGAQGGYPLMYYSHNLHFLAHSAAMAGRYEEARRAAKQLEQNVAPHADHMAMMQIFTPTDLLVLTRFGRWKDILALPTPNEARAFDAALRHFARGLALAATGDLAGARREQAALEKSAKAAEKLEVSAVGNTPEMILGVARGLLEGAIAEKAGDRARALAALRQAVAREDALHYTEPPDWFLPARESLGAALLRAGDPAAAEQVFRDDLKRNPRSGRSLFGLAQALRAQKKDYDARLVDAELRAAWKGADTELRSAD